MPSASLCVRDSLTGMLPCFRLKCAENVLARDLGDNMPVSGVQNVHSEPQPHSVFGIGAKQLFDEEFGVQTTFASFDF
jgi:hypothetical protein